MIDTISIAFSLGMVIYILLRANRLDRQVPWFGSVGEKSRNSPSGKGQ